MPTGIKDSTFVFSRCLAQVLRAHRAYAVNYVDDVCITGVPPMCGHSQSYTSAIAFVNDGFIVADGKKDSARAKGAPVKRGSGVFGPAGLGPNAGPSLYLYNLNKRRAAELKATMDTFDAESKHGLTKVVGFVLNIRNQNGPDGMTLADGLVLATTVATFLHVLMEGGALSQYGAAEMYRDGTDPRSNAFSDYAHVGSTRANQQIMRNGCTGKLAWTKNVDTSSEERRVIRLLAPLDRKSVRTMPNRSESRPCSEESIECKGMYKLHGVPQPYHAACQTGIQLRYTSLAQPYTKHR